MTSAVASGEQQPADQRPALKVLCYNVLQGFRQGESYKPAIEWVTTLEPDIVGWQELFGWNEARLQGAAQDWNHPHAVALKDGGYNLGLTSRRPIEVIERRTERFHHGYLHCRTSGVDVIVVHLWPGTRSQQIGEAIAVRDKVVGLAAEGREVILMGDFNAHSAADQTMLVRQQPLLDRRWTADAPKIPTERFIVEGKFTFHVMNTVFEAPLVDVVRSAFDRANANPDYEEQLVLGSFPTRVLQHAATVETQQGFLERIDFILATPNLANRCVEARVCRDDARLELISDHYPVFAAFARAAEQ